MKNRFPICSQPRRHRLAGGQRPRSETRQSGVALVVTLILLAAIATLAIAFLALTYRETASVDAMGRTTDSELSADSALERAKAETLAIFPIKNQSITNPIEFLGPDMFVSVCCQSTNWENGNLVFPQINRLDSAARLDPTNRYDSAPPVFVNTNRPGQTGPIDDRFFFDFNRNGSFEESGFVPVVNDAGQVVIEAGNVKTNFVIGDPHWIGVLQDPRRPHGPDNRYIGRYAFMVLPSGRTLDANWIHNDAISRAVPTRSGFYRNQGVGTWELNLAAFLTDLNTNWWQNVPNSTPYSYIADPDPTKLGGDGDAFTDARELLLFRFYDNLNLRNTANDLFPLAATGIFGSDRIDAYTDAFLGQPTPNSDDDPLRHWSGSDSPRHFASPSDFFDRARLPELQAGDQFREKLVKTSTGTSTYDRYTYYRLLQQL